MEFFTALTAYGDWSLLILRLAIGVIFLVHGIPKLKNIASFMGFIGVAETLGGAAVLVGFLTPLAALGLSIIMVGAIYKKVAEWHVPFSKQGVMGWEFDLMILAGCINLIVLGAGAISIDAMGLLG